MNRKYVLGIDVSFCQGPNLDFQSIKAAGIKFAVSKATHGAAATSIDPTFSSNWKKCQAAGLARGSYHWFVPTDDPIAQADHYCAVLKANGFNNGDLPPAIDFEKVSVITGRALIDRLLIMVKRVRELTGRVPLLYTGKWFWSGACLDVDSPELVALTFYWHAEYPSSRRIGTEYDAAIKVLPSPHLALPWASRGISQTFHQFDGDHGLILPQGTDSDFNVFWGDEADFVAWMATTFIAAPAPEVPAPPPAVEEPAPEPPAEVPADPPAEVPVQPEAPTIPETQTGMVAVNDNNIFTFILNIIRTILTFIVGGKK